MSPVYFGHRPEAVFFATESSSVKYQDLKENPLASLVVDDFEAGWLPTSMKNRPELGRTATKERAVVVGGSATILADGKGQTYGQLYRKLFAKYPDYKAEGWEKGEAPIIVLRADRVNSWGL